jgi:hypothetical protein
LLLERDDDPAWRGLAIAASSPRLRPALGYRDVVDDDGLGRVQARLRALVAGPLRERAFAGLSAASADEPARDTFARAAAWHARRPDFDPDPWDTLSILHTAAREPAPLTVGRIAGRHRDDCLVLAPAPSALVDALIAADYTVVLAPEPDDAIAELLRALARDGIEVVRARTQWCLAAPLPEPVDPGLAPLCDALAVLLRTMGGHAERIRPAAIPDPDPAPLVAADGDGALLRRVDPRTSQAPALVLAADRPAVTAALAHATRDPWYAALLFAKDLLAPLDSAAQSRLLLATLDAKSRPRRSRS